MNCQKCNKRIVNGTIKGGYTYCSDEHAQSDWYNDKADNYAYRMSHGQYYNYEDYMEHEHNATIAYDEDVLEREF